MSIDSREIEAIYAAAILDQTDRHDRPQIGFPRTTAAVQQLVDREVEAAVSKAVLRYGVQPQERK
jgi:hypothetical protein